MIGRNIKRVLERQGKTQRELAEAIGITEASMSRYIHGDRVPKATTLVKIANALGVTPDQLLSDKDNPIESSLTQKALDTISRQDAIDALMDFDKKLRKINWYQYPHTEYECRGVDEAIVKIENVPSAQTEPLSDAYTKAVWTWLLDYQIKAAELKGRYTLYEVLSWVANDWRKENR